jgi:signal transduction histidine kinase
VQNLPMKHPSWARVPASKTLEVALLTVAAFAVLVGIVELGLFSWRPWTAGSILQLELVVCAWIYVGAGLTAWRRRPSNRLGVLMVYVGGTFLIAALGGLSSTSLQMASIVLGTLSLAAVFHLLLTFPSGRLRSPLPRLTVVWGYFVSLVMQIPLYLFAPTGTPLTVSVRPHLYSFAKDVQEWSGVLAVLAAVIVLFDRWQKNDHRKRVILAPLFIYSVLAVILIPVFANVFQPALRWNPTYLDIAQVGELSLIPVFFLAAMLRGGFARTSAVVELAGWIGASSASRPHLREALAITLGDDSIQLMFWSNDNETYVGSDGSPQSVPLDNGSRSMEAVYVGERLVGAIVYDAKLISESGDVRAASEVVALAVDRDRLVVDLRVSQASLRDSRARIAEAGHAERRRVAQRLHDDLQGRLVMLAVGVQQLAADSQMSQRLQVDAVRLRTQLDQITDQLRELVYDLMPAPLIERGIRAAVDDLIDRVPLPVSTSISIPAGRLSDAVEGLTYFVVSEAVTNTLKHAGARGITLSIATSDTLISICVSDDGRGGVDTAPRRGLRSLADRVEALGGRFRVASPPGGGTAIRVELPLQRPGIEPELVDAVGMTR